MSHQLRKSEERKIRGTCMISGEIPSDRITEEAWARGIMQQREARNLLLINMSGILGLWKQSLNRMTRRVQVHTPAMSERSQREASNKTAETHLVRCNNNKTSLHASAQAKLCC